jgi:hypothetical protein
MMSPCSAEAEVEVEVEVAVLTLCEVVSYFVVGGIFRRFGLCGFEDSGYVVVRR